jgi:hypothetical protein
LEVALCCDWGLGRKPSCRLTSKRDPSAREALLRMTAKYGLGGGTEGLGEEDRLNPHPLLRGAKSAAPEKSTAGV